jgi:hypothetical protein
VLVPRLTAVDDCAKDMRFHDYYIILKNSCVDFACYTLDNNVESFLIIFQQTAAATEAKKTFPKKTTTIGIQNIT